MLTLTYDFTALNEGMQELAERIGDCQTVHRLVGEVLLDQNIHRFLDEESPDGGKWAPLSPVTLANRRSGSGILRDSGELFRSIHMKATSENAQIGTNLNHPKVMVMHHGATIRPRNGKALVIPGGRGANRPVFAREVTIPARPYIGIGPDDENAITEVLIDYLEG